MTQGKQQPKFERNPCLRFRGVTDDGRTDDRRMTDKFQFHELCWDSQADLINDLYICIFPNHMLSIKFGWKSQIFTSFALWSAFSKIWHILGFSHSLPC